MNAEEKLRLQKLACQVRMGIIEGVYHAKSGHPGGSLSSADVFTYLYFKELHVDPANPKWEDRDRFVLSKGHTAPGLYAALANRGFFPVEDLQTLRHVGSHLQGHPNMNTTPGVDMSTGSLGQGVSAAAGMALAAKHQGKNVRVYTLLGDGEIAEGQCWESFLFASHYKLDNLCVIVDINGLQIDGRTRDVMNTEPLDKKLEAFGFAVTSVDGHDFDDLERGFKLFHETTGKPTCILMHTVKGKGVPFMEDQAGWHGKAPNSEEYPIAMEALQKCLTELEGK